MIIGVALIIVCGLILFIWVMAEFRKFKHKMWAFFLIALVVFGYISFTITTKDQGVDLKSFSGVLGAVKIYFSWLGGMFGNLKSITANAIGMDWGVDNKNSSSKDK